MSLPKTTRVCIYTHPYDVCIMRPGIYGNPYSIGRDGTRSEVITKFKKYFDKRIHDDIYFLQAVGELRGKRIGCCCSLDEDCHGDIYVEFLNVLENLNN